MNRKLLAALAFVFVAILAIALWLVSARPKTPASQASLKDTLHSAITNPVSFAKSRFTGGVGAIMTVDSATGMPRIMKVMPGSPAEKAGLRADDLILQVDGVATSGRSLKDNIEGIRGFSAGSVTLVVQRAGSTNLQCVIRRTSWNSLGVPQ